MLRTIEGCSDERLVVVVYRQIVNTHTVQPDVYIAVEERELIKDVVSYVLRRAGSMSRAYDDALALFS